jgi:hypothetical protein
MNTPLDYERPAIEREVTPDEVSRETHYAGGTASDVVSPR